jgi:glutaredoxin-related protein
MKGTPQHPECDFSRAVVEMLDHHGVPPDKMHAYNVLADPELHSGIKEFTCVPLMLYLQSADMISLWVGGRCSPTIPQVYVHAWFIGGHDILLKSEWCIYCSSAASCIPPPGVFKFAFSRRMLIRLFPLHPSSCSYVCLYSAPIRRAREAAHLERDHPGEAPRTAPGDQVVLTVRRAGTFHAGQRSALHSSLLTSSTSLA